MDTAANPAAYTIISAAPIATMSEPTYPAQRNEKERGYMWLFGSGSKGRIDDMISNRVRGLTLMHWLSQTACLLVLFWIWVTLDFCWLHEAAFMKRQYAIYSLVLVAASLVDLGQTNLRRKNLLHLDIIRNHSISLRQTCIILGHAVDFLRRCQRHGDVAIVSFHLRTGDLSYCCSLQMRLFRGGSLRGFLADGIAQILCCSAPARMHEIEAVAGTQSDLRFSACRFDHGRNQTREDCDLPVLGGISVISLKSCNQAMRRS